MSDHIYIETDIFDNVTVNGRISKKLCQKVFVNKIASLQKELQEKTELLSKARELLLDIYGNCEHCHDREDFSEFLNKLMTNEENK